MLVVKYDGVTISVDGSLSEQGVKKLGDGKLLDLLMKLLPLLLAFLNSGGTSGGVSDKP